MNWEVVLVILHVMEHSKKITLNFTYALFYYKYYDNQSNSTECECVLVCWGKWKIQLHTKWI